MGLLVCFAGRIGSGKSSVTQALAEHLGWNFTGFGDFLRAELIRRGSDPSSRKALQEVGQEMVEKDPEEFCRAVLNAGKFQPGGDLLIDGVRHVEIQKILTRIALPSAARLIFIDADDAIRLERVEGRVDGRADFVRAEAHRVEADLREGLPAMADVIVDARQDFSIVVEQCLIAIRQWCSSSQ